MARLVVAVVIGSHAQGGYHIFESHEIHVGRGFKNDLILSDPYVSERHLLISRHGHEIRITDLSSKNGTYLPKLKHTVHESVIASGDELMVGMTKLRIFSDTHKIYPARALHQKNTYVTWMRKPVVAWCMAGVVLGQAVLAGYLKTYTKTSVVKLLPAPIIALIAVLLWSGVWSFVGRLTRHKIRFSIHLSTICLVLILGEILGNLAEYIGFYANSPIIQEVLVYASWVGLSIAFLYATFSVATNMRHNTKIIVSSTFTLLWLVAIVGLLASYREYYFTGAIPYSKTLKPPVLGSPSGMSIDAFLIRADRVFEFDIKDK